MASALIAAAVSLAVVQLNDKKESQRRTEEHLRQIRRVERDHYRAVHTAALTAARNYMRAMSDFASFTYRRKTNTLGRVVVDEPELVRRLIDADREMAHQEAVMNLSQDSGAYTSYLEVTRTLRDVRHLIDQGKPDTGLAPGDVHPDHPEWAKAYAAHVRARNIFVENALRHIGDPAGKTVLALRGWTRPQSEPPGYLS